MQKYIKYKKQYQKDQQTINSFNKLHCKGLQDNLFDKNEYEPLCIFLLDMLMKQNANPFYKYEHKNKISFFNKNKLKFNLEPRSPRSKKSKKSQNQEDLKPRSPRNPRTKKS